MKNQSSKHLLFISIILSLILSLTLIGISGVSALNICDADLNNGRSCLSPDCSNNNTCLIVANTKLTLNGTYNLNVNGSSTGAITINGNNATLDCNGSTIYGNFTNVGVYSSFKSNITIINCTFKNYFKGASISSGSNIFISDSTFLNNTEGVRITGAGNNFTSINNKYYNSSTYNSYILSGYTNTSFINDIFTTKNYISLYGTNLDTFNVINTTFIGTNQSNERVYFTNVTNLNFSGNNLTNMQDLVLWNQGSMGCSNVSIDSNYFFNSTVGYGIILVGINATNINITNNIFTNISKGFFIDPSATNVYFEDNIITYLNECQATVGNNECSFFSNRDYHLNTGTYYINNSYALTTNGINVNIDCNGSTIIGDNSGYGLTISTGTNITINNCTFKNFNRGLSVTNGLNINISNSTFINNSNHLRLSNTNKFYSNNNNYSSAKYDSYDIYILPSSNINFNNDYLDSKKYGVYSTSSFNLSFNGLKFYGFGNSTSVLIFQNNSGILLINSNFSHFGYLQFTLSGSTNIGANKNIIINNNSFYNSTYIYALFLAGANESINNVTVSNNVFNYSDIAIKLTYNVSNVLISGNIIDNANTYYDEYCTGIFVMNDRIYPTRRSINVTIKDNIFNNFGCTGVLVRGAKNVLIQNNTFNQDLNTLLNLRGSYFRNNATFNLPYYTRNDPLTAIFITEIYRGYLDPGTQGTDTYSFVSQFTSDNITLIGNDFGNVNVRLRTQGTTNLTQDLTNYWFRSFQDPYFTDRDDFYISNDWNNITGINPTGVLSNMFQTGIGNQWGFNYTFFKNYDYYKNIKQGIVSNIDMNLSIFNKTNYLFTFSNGTSIYQSGTNLQYNLTLNAGEWVYVFDNFNYRTDFDKIVSVLGLEETISIYHTLGYNVPNTDPSTSNLVSYILQALIVVLGLALCMASLYIFYQYAKNNYDLIPVEQLVRSVIVFIIAEVLIIALISYIITLI